jgi:WD40 repeat protein
MVSKLFLLCAAAAVVWIPVALIRTCHPEFARGIVVGEHAGPVVATACVPGTSNIVTLDTTGEVLLRDAATRRVRASFGSPTAPASSIALAPDGGTLATGGRDGAVTIWQMGNGEHRILLTSALGPIRALAFSPDRKTIAAAEGETVILLDTVTLRVRSTLRGHDGIVLALSFSPDGRSLASVGRDRTIRIWDIAAGQPRATLRCDTGLITETNPQPDWVTEPAERIDRERIPALRDI